MYLPDNSVYQQNLHKLIECKAHGISVNYSYLSIYLFLGGKLFLFIYLFILFIYLFYFIIFWGGYTDEVSYLYHKNATDLAWIRSVIWSTSAGSIHGGFNVLVFLFLVCEVPTFKYSLDRYYRLKDTLNTVVQIGKAEGNLPTSVRFSLYRLVLSLSCPSN